MRYLTVRFVPALVGALTMWLGSFGVSWSSGPPTAIEKPPRPVVKSHGEREYAKRGSFCWTQSDGEGICADYPRLPIPTRRFVPVHPGGRVTVNLRHPGDDLIVRTRRTGSNPWVPTRPLNSTGRRWSFRLPDGVNRTKQVILDAKYHGGNDEAIFGIQLKLHCHS